MAPTTLRLALLAVVAPALVPSPARGNGFALDTQGVFANGTAGAGVGATRDAAVLFTNPAGISALDGTRVTAGGMLVLPRAPYTDAGSTLAVGAPIPGTEGDGATNGAVPWVFASRRLSPSLTIGFGLAAPFGLAADFGRDSGFVGRYQGIESRIEALAFGPALAWRIADAVAIGGSFEARRDHVVQSLSLDLGSACVGALAQQGDPNPADTCATSFGLAPGTTDAYGRFAGEGWGWTATLGATFEPARGTTLGVAWRHESSSEVRGDETFELPPGGSDFLAASGAPGALTGSRAGLDYQLPDFVTVHASQRLGAVTLLAAWQWSRWSPFDEVKLTADSDATGLSVTSAQSYRDASRFALGAAWSVRSGLDLFAGAAWEQTPVQDAYRQATLPETDSILAGIGGEVALRGGFSLAAAWQHVEASGRGSIDQLGASGDHLVGSARTRADLVLAQVSYRGR